MQFNLPDQLALQVASYDKTRKKLAAVMAAEDGKTKKKNTHPNGKPSNLIPSDIVSDRNWNEVVDFINSKPAKDKVRLITKPVFGADPQPIAIVYYYKQLWVAAWLPRHEDDGYVYGLSFTFKDTAAARKQCNDKFITKSNSVISMFNHRDENADQMLPRIKDGRTYWYRKTLFFTKEDFSDGYTSNYWKQVTNNHGINNYGSTWNMSKFINEWAAQLLKNIPEFVGGNDSNHFYRMNPENCIFENIMEGYYSRPRWMNHIDKYVHDLDAVIDSLAKRFRSCYLEDVWSAKWFRSKVAKAMKDTYNIHEEQTKLLKYDRQALQKPYAILYQFIDSIVDIKSIYNNVDLNLLNSRYDWLCRCELPGHHSSTGYQWMRDNLPVESFLNMLHMHYKHEIEEKEWTRADQRTGNKHVYFSLWRDTYQMLTQCIAAERTDNLKPKRWRLQDWHDHLMAETWKIQNPNVALPQKLFPEPIKVEQCDDGELNKYSFFQPIDTHQLAAWGRAVRNCVGGGHGYAEGIKKMKHLIILCMIDNKPRYTIQLTVDNGVMTVNQIADIGNKRLTDIERSNVEDAFKQALTTREQQLT